jgi:predicted RNase H-like HicB family nuclease
MYFTAIIEHCRDTGLYVGYVPNFAGAHSQGKTLNELNKNLQEVIEMIFDIAANCKRHRAYH